MSHASVKVVMLESASFVLEANLFIVDCTIASTLFSNLSRVDLDFTDVDSISWRIWSWIVLFASAKSSCNCIKAALASFVAFPRAALASALVSTIDLWSSISWSERIKHLCSIWHTLLAFFDINTCSLAHHPRILPVVTVADPPLRSWLHGFETLNQSILTDCFDAVRFILTGNEQRVTRLRLDWTSASNLAHRKLGGKDGLEVLNCCFCVMLRPLNRMTRIQKH